MGSAAASVRAGGSSSVRQDVFVVGHGIHVVARLADPRPGVRVRRGAGWGQQGCAVPQAEMPQDFFHHGALVNHGDDAHGVLAVGADERVGVPHLEDEVAPFLGGKFSGRRRSPGRAQRCGGRATVLGAVALAAP